MSSYSKMVLISELEYLNLRNFKYLPHEFERRSEGFDEHDDEQADETEVFLNATTPQPAESQPGETTPPRNVHLDDGDEYDDGYDAYQARNDDFRSVLNTLTPPAQSQVDLYDEL